MKKITYYHYLLVVCFLGSTLLEATHATPYFSIRSQSVNGARKLAGWADKINLYRPDSCENYFVGSMLYEYTRSFRYDNLARSLFGDACIQGCKCPTIKISGKNVAGRSDSDWLADYFYLPSDFQSLVSLKPRIENHIVDFNLYWGLDEWYEGGYLWIQAPAVHTKWKLNYCEEIIDRGDDEYARGYFDASGTGSAFEPLNGIERTQLLDSFSEYISQEGVIKFANPPFYANDSVEFQRYIQYVAPLQYSKWGDCNTRLNETRLSDVHVTLGWNIWQCEDYHVGLSFKVAVPTGNRPKGEYFFEPIVGNGHHWEVGGGFSFHDVFWRGCDDDRYCGFYLEAAITHLFKDRQCRVFDLVNGCNSRYMLAHKLDQPVVNLVAGADLNSAIAPSAQLKLQYQPVANLTKALVNISYNVQADIVAMFSCGGCNWAWDFGYNAWVRSCEKIDFDSCTPCIEKPLLNNRLWALKGDAQVAGYDLTDNSAVTLSATQSGATLHTGLNEVEANKANATMNANQNPGVDNAVFAFSPSSGVALETSPGSGDTILTSLEPVFLSFEDVNVCGARTKGVSHKIFTNLNYNWDMNDCCYAPYLGVGAEVEFGRTTQDKSFCKVECREDVGCKKAALSQWGIWVKGGFSYN